jgi:hypothetical protein
MPNKVFDEIVVAKLSIEAASVALESLFQKMEASPRAEKMMINQTVHEACQRLKAAQALLAALDRLAIEPE